MKAVLCSLLVVFFLAAAQADYIYTATLNTAQEVVHPSGSPNVTGTGRVVVTDDGKTCLQARIDIPDVSGFTSFVTKIHLHNGAPGVNGTIIHVYLNNLTGVDPDGLFPVDLQSPLALNDSEADAVRNGNWYFNVHTVLNPLGEIRGQISFSFKNGTGSPAPTRNSWASGLLEVADYYLN